MDNLHVSGVYSIQNLVDGKRYIGSTSRSVKKRWVQHRSHLRAGKHHSVLLQRSWNKYKEEFFEFSVLERCVPGDCLVREQFYIDKYATASCASGYNILPTAGSTMGAKRPHSKETRAKLSRAAQNRSPEIRARISESARNMRPELRAKITASASKPRSLETRAKMVAARKKLMEGTTGKELRAKLSAATTLAMTPERCARLSARMLGSSPSEESWRKMSIAARNRRSNRNLLLELPLSPAPESLRSLALEHGKGEPID